MADFDAEIWAHGNLTPKFFGLDSRIFYLFIAWVFCPSFLSAYVFYAIAIIAVLSIMANSKGVSAPQFFRMIFRIFFVGKRQRTNVLKLKNWERY